MQQVHTLDEVNRILTKTFPPPTSMREDYSLDRMYRLMELLDNPQNRLSIIHIAGTSGKTSTSYYVAALLKAGGQKVGLTVSPHIETVNERVQIDALPLSEAQFCTYFSEYRAIKGLVELRPSYFEAIIGFAFWVFAREQVDYAVIEVGLGGLGDATNVINRPDKVCVITDIGLDHMQVLGETITKITRQKAGIIQQRNSVLTLQQDHQIMDVIEEVSQTQHAPLTVVKPKQLGFLADLPPFARRDWQLAEATYRLLSNRDDVPQLSHEELVKTSHTVVPARMEVITVQGKTIVLDGSHNQQKLQALGEGLQERFPGQPVAVLLSFVQSRAEQLEEVAATIAPMVQAAIVTSYSSHQDFYHMSIDPYQVQTALRAAGVQDSTVVDDPKAAFRTLLKRPEPILLVTGSFYLQSHIRPIIKELLKES